jgi:ACS family tartrate transporter-like MFS transporter
MEALSRHSSTTQSASGFSSSVISKITGRLIPFLFLLYIVAYLDRINVGFAALQMQRQLHFNDKVYGLGAGIFFAGYLIFQIPSNLALRRIGARRWICILMAVWGLISSSTAFISTPKGFYFLRFLLGSAEAGFFPGLVFYIRSWFPAVVRARTVALFMAAGPLSGVVGGPLSGFLLGLQGHGKLAGWQWLFLIEGLPAILLGLLVFFSLPDTPRDANWLDSDQKNWLIDTLRLEESTPGTNKRVIHVFAIWSAWLLSLALFGITTCTSGLSLWLPILIRSVSGHSNLMIGFLSAIPYILAAIAEVIIGTHSDSSGERRWHIAAPALIGCIAIIGAASFLSLPAVLACVSIAILCVYSTFGPFWAISTVLLDAESAAPGIALINSVGNLGGFFGPYVIGAIRNATGTFRGGFFIAAIALALCAAIILTMRGGSRTHSRITSHA